MPSIARTAFWQPCEHCHTIGFGTMMEAIGCKTCDLQRQVCELLALVHELRCHMKADEAAKAAYADATIGGE